MVIVLDDADLELAAKSCVDGALKNAGQRCDAASAVLVQELVADEFVSKVMRRIDSRKVGDPRDESINMDPLISEGAAAYVEELVKDAVEKGVKLLSGRERRDNYFEPTVLDNGSLTARIAWEETFDPVVTIIRIRSEDEPIDIGQKSNYGLVCLLEQLLPNVEDSKKVAGRRNNHKRSSKEWRWLLPFCRCKIFRSRKGRHRSQY